MSTDVRSAKVALARKLAVYTLARLLFVALVVGVLLGIAKMVDVQIPLLVALIVAVIIQLPLSYMLLGGLRRNLTADMEVVGAQRREDKEHLRAQLRGEREAE